MAKKKRHINNLEELEQAMRIVGGIFPHTIEELELTCKLVNEEDISKVSEKYSFQDIWNASEPISKKANSKIIHHDFQNDIDKSWGLAARGSHTLTKNVIDKMIENEDSYDK